MKSGFLGLLKKKKIFRPNYSHEKKNFFVALLMGVGIDLITIKLYNGLKRKKI